MRIGGAKTASASTVPTRTVATRAAAEIGVAPGVMDFIEPEGYFIARFIRGREMPPAEMRQPGTLGEIAGL